MAWFWTDDLARTLLDRGVERERVLELLDRPAAISASDLDSAVETARRMIGLADSAAGAA